MHRMFEGVDQARSLSRAVRRGLAVVLLAASAALVPAVASAQSAFNGRAADESGGVLPGVTVEVASPAIIEGSRSAITDDQGRYTITDLRPGTYTITFTLPGFATIIRNEVNLPADFTMTINGDMKVGGLEETLTVTGAAPVVDVTQAQKTEVLTREQLDSLPVGKTLQARAALVPLITTNVDVGGSQNMDQQNVRTAGTEDNEVTVFVDGMLLNSNSSDGASQYYFNDAMPQQVSIQTSGVDAETQAGGVRINVVPKEGGNSVHGSMYIDGANDKMMSSNLSNRLQGLGVDSVDSLARAYDFNAGVGGPLKKDKLWWFFTGHRKALDQKVLGSFYPDGTPGVNDVIIHGMQLRLTYQISSKHKVSAFYDDNNKVEYHNFQAGEDILTVSQTRGVNKKGPRYAAQTKWTGTFSSKLLAEAGWGTNRVDYVNKGLPEAGTRKDRPASVRTCLATPCLSFDPAQAGASVNPWYTTTSNFDPEKPIFRWGNVTDDFHKVPQRYIVTTKLTYVTGSHNVKFGVQNSFGPENWTRIDNADLQSVEFRNGVPESVVVRNSPTASSGQVNKDLGVYAQDSWHLNRLTVSPGVRLEWFESQVNDETAPAGRWVAARNYQSFKINPAWFDVSPRLGLAYDLFGDSRTAIKFDAGKYVHALTLSLVDRYNPMFATTERRLWADCYRDGASGLSCSGANPYGTNGDKIVQDWEIAPGSSSFGTRNVNTPDPDLKRDYYFRTGVSLEHEMAHDIGLSAGWYYTDYRNMRTFVNNVGAITNFSTNVLRNLGDYDAFQINNPLAGHESEKITVYNLKREKLTAVQNIDTNVASESGQKYVGIVLGVRTRVSGANLFGGVTFERQTSKFCDSPDNPNQLRFCDTTGGSGEADALANVPRSLAGSGFDKAMPFQANFKLGGDYQLPYGVQLSTAFRSLPGAERIVTYSVPTTAFTAAGLTRTQAVTVRLNEPGSMYLERINIVDLGVNKWVELPGSARVKAGLNVYNLLNPDTITGQINAFGPTLDDITGVVLGRFWRASASLQW